MKDPNWPTLSTAQIDAMTDAALRQPQERNMIIFWRRPVMAFVAGIVLLFAVVASWNMPHSPAALAPSSESMAAISNEMSDYITYELLEDFS